MPNIITHSLAVAAVAYCYSGNCCGRSYNNSLAIIFVSRCVIDAVAVWTGEVRALRVEAIGDILRDVTSLVVIGDGDGGEGFRTRNDREAD